MSVTKNSRGHVKPQRPTFYNFFLKQTFRKLLLTLFKNMIIIQTRIN